MAGEEWQRGLHHLLLVACAVGINGSAPPLGQNILTVVVVDQSTALAISGAEVRIQAIKLAVLSDSAGAVTFRNLDDGLVRIGVTRPGYVARTATVVLGLSDSTAVVLTMQSGTQQLDAVTVIAPRSKPYLREFDVRRMQGLGHFLTETQLDSARHDFLADFLARRFPGVRAEWNPSHLSVKFGRAGYYALSDKSTVKSCTVRVYIDDMVAQPGDVGALRATDVAGVEYHSNAPPVQYRTAGSQCGVILIWTKR